MILRREDCRQENNCVSWLSRKLQWIKGGCCNEIAKEDLNKSQSWIKREESKKNIARVFVYIILCMIEEGYLHVKRYWKIGKIAEATIRSCLVWSQVD